MTPEQLHIFEAITHWLSVSFYGASSGYCVHGLVRGRTRDFSIGIWLAAIGMLPHTVSLAARWWAVDHGPYLLKDESFSALALGIISMYLLLTLRSPKVRGLGGILLPGVVALMVAARIFTGQVPMTRPPATFEGIWFIIHIVSIVPAMGAFFIAASAAVLYLVKEKWPHGGVAEKVPLLPVLDTCNYLYAGLALFFWGIMTVSGAVWADQSWGRYWAWDPVETWSLITWLCIGLLLHLRRFHGWHGKKAAWFTMVCFLVSLLTLFFLPLVTGSIHSEYLL